MRNDFAATGSPLAVSKAIVRARRIVSTGAAIGMLLCAAGSDGVGPDESAPAPTGCDEAQATEVAKRVQGHYDGVRDLAADFEQTSRSVVLAGASLAEAEVTRGKVVFAKPGRMRWSYESPEQSLVVSDGATLWIYDVAAAQVSRLPVGDGYLAGAALQFLLGEGRLLETFDVSAAECSDELVVLELLPREPASYERLGLSASSTTGRIVETTIVDLFGNRTAIRFDNMRINQAPPKSLFEFEVPSGVELIDLAGQR